MNEGLLRIEDGEFSIWAQVCQCGEDWSVTIGGGTHDHIGAIAIGLPRPSLDDPHVTSASVSSFCVPGHKDDEIARDAALRLASTFNCCVSVTCGIHVDNAQAKDLERLLCNYHELITQLIS